MSCKPAKRRCGGVDVARANEYVCVDGTRVAATDAAAIAHDRRVRAVIDAAQRLSSFVPADVAMSDYLSADRTRVPTTERPGRSEYYNVAAEDRGRFFKESFKVVDSKPG